MSDTENALPPYRLGDPVEVRMDWNDRGPQEWLAGEVLYADKCEVLVLILDKSRTVPLRRTSDRLRHRTG